MLALASQGSLLLYGCSTSGSSENIYRISTILPSLPLGRGPGPRQRVDRETIDGAHHALRLQRRRELLDPVGEQNVGLYEALPPSRRRVKLIAALSERAVAVAVAPRSAAADDKAAAAVLATARDNDEAAVVVGRALLLAAPLAPSVAHANDSVIKVRDPRRAPTRLAEHCSENRCERARVRCRLATRGANRIAARIAARIASSTGSTRTRTRSAARDSVERRKERSEHSGRLRRETRRRHEQTKT